MDKEVFKPVSNTRIVPQNGKVLIKIVNSGLPAIGIVNNKLPEGVLTDVRFYVEGTSKEEFNIGDNVVLAFNPMNDDDARALSSRIIDEDNKQCYLSVKEAIDDLDSAERLELIKSGSLYTIIEYALVDYFDIIATIKPIAK